MSSSLAMVTVVFWWCWFCALLLLMLFAGVRFRFMPRRSSSAAFSSSEDFQICTRLYAPGRARATFTLDGPPIAVSTMWFGACTRQNQRPWYPWYCSSSRAAALISTPTLRCTRVRRLMCRATMPRRLPSCRKELHQSSLFAMDWNCTEISLSMSSVARAAGALKLET